MTRARWKTALHAAGGLILWGGLFLLTDSLCWVQALFGFPCPGCGSTRAAAALFRGHFAEAFVWHPLIPLSLAILPYALFRETLIKSKPVKAVEKYAAIGAIALYIVVYIVRMVRLFPHTEPMVPLESAFWPKILRWIGSLIT